MTPLIYTDLLLWIKENSYRIQVDVETDIDNMEKRQAWADQAHSDLLAIRAKVGID